jgi:hypothetical protein
MPGVVLVWSHFAKARYSRQSKAMASPGWAEVGGHENPPRRVLQLTFVVCLERADSHQGVRGIARQPHSENQVSVLSLRICGQSRVADEGCTAIAPMGGRWSTTRRFYKQPDPFSRQPKGQVASTESEERLSLTWGYSGFEQVIEGANAEKPMC